MPLWHDIILKYVQSRHATGAWNHYAAEWGECQDEVGEELPSLQYSATRQGGKEMDLAVLLDGL